MHAGVHNIKTGVFGNICLVSLELSINLCYLRKRLSRRARHPGHSQSRHAGQPSVVHVVPGPV